MQAIDYAKIVAKRDNILLYEAFPQASAKFGVPEQELKTTYEIRQLELKLTKKVAKVKKYARND
jgi:hypothetical protein